LNNQLNNEFTESNENIEDLKKENLELKEIINLKEKEMNTIVLKLNQKISQIYEDKDKLFNELRTLQMKELDLKLKNYNQNQIDRQRLEHRLSLTQQSLKQAKNDIKTLKSIISELEKQNLFDFILNKKTNSYYNYFKSNTDNIEQ
jgi:chromosome segregation ATPase